MKRVAIYVRVSTGDQHPETQLYDLRGMAKQRGYEIVHEYSDVISGSKAKRPGLDALMADARRRRFDVVLVAAFDRVAETCGIEGPTSRAAIKATSPTPEPRSKTR